MSAPGRARAAWSSRGASLIELMVALTIGLIVSAAVLSAYQGASSANKMADAQGRMNEDAQAALALLTQQLRMAGNNPEQPNRVANGDPTLSSRRNPVYTPQPAYPGYALLPASAALSSFAVRGCDSNFGNLNTASDIDHLNCATGSDGAADSIAISYEADRFNTVPVGVGSASLPTDCLGLALTTLTATLPASSGGGIANSDVHYAVADNRFYIDSKSGTPSLYCRGNGIGGTAQALVDNIESLQFVYGVTALGSAVAGYLSASQILANTALALLPTDAARWQKVVSVRICVLARSQNAVAPNLQSAGYIRCDGSLEAAPPDLRLRHAYTTTVVLRNRRI